jgi:hypothetical protein
VPGHQGRLTPQHLRAAAVCATRVPGQQARDTAGTMLSPWRPCSEHWLAMQGVPVSWQSMLKRPTSAARDTAPPSFNQLLAIKRGPTWWLGRKEARGNLKARNFGC